MDRYQILEDLKSYLKKDLEMYAGQQWPPLDDISIGCRDTIKQILRTIDKLEQRYE